MGSGQRVARTAWRCRTAAASGSSVFPELSMAEGSALAASGPPAAWTAAPAPGTIPSAPGMTRGSASVAGSVTAGAGASDRTWYAS